MRLLSISVLVLVLLGMGILTVRFYGQSKGYAQYEHVFWSQQSSQEFLVTPWEQNFIVEQQPDWILWADVQQSKSDLLLARPWAERKTANPPEQLEPNPARPLLLDLLNQFPKNRFILNVVDNKRDIHLRLLEVIKNANAFDRVVINSDFQIVLEATKTEAPAHLFGSSLSDFTRFKTFESLWVLPATPFKGDFLIGPLAHRNVPLFSPSIVNEIHRRFKKIIIGPLENLQQIDQARELKPDGLFVTDPLMVKK